MTLPATADLLHRRRASLIGDDVIQDYVALRWLEWHGGALRLTVVGRTICARLAELANPGELPVSTSASPCP